MVFVEALKRCSVEAIDQFNRFNVQRFNVISISDLPALNASLNLISTIFISMGWYFIRHGAWRRHMACMITAVMSSALFLDGLHYLSRPNVGEKSSGYTGWIAAIYFPILASHVLLAFVTLASGDYDACPGFSPQMGSPQANRALDDPNLALRLSHRRVRVFDALQVVSARGVTQQSCT